MLRSRKEAIEPEQTTPAKNWSQHGQAQAEFAARERAVLEMDDISGKGKTHLQAVLRMEQVMRESGSASTEVQHYIDRKGVVVFTFQGGGKVRDNGAEILFSAKSEPVRQIALLYAQKKWGKQIVLEENKIMRREERTQVMER